MGADNMVDVVVRLCIFVVVCVGCLCAGRCGCVFVWFECVCFCGCVVVFVCVGEFCGFMRLGLCMFVGVGVCLCVCEYCCWV